MSPRPRARSPVTVEWFHVLRLAQLLRRGVVQIAQVTDARGHEVHGSLRGDFRTATGGSSMVVQFAVPRGDVRTLLADVDRQQEAEWAMTAFGEVAAGLSALPYELPPVPCPACGVDRDALCRPLHPGERDPGGWSHPAREQWAKSESQGTREEWRPHPHAGEVATRVLAERRFSASGSRDLEILARTVLAYQRWAERGGQLTPPGTSQAEQMENIRRYVEMGVMSVDDARRAMRDLTTPTVTIRGGDPETARQAREELERTRSVARALVLDSDSDVAAGEALDRHAQIVGLTRGATNPIDGHPETDAELRERVLLAYRAPQQQQRTCNQETAEHNPRGLPYLCRRSFGHRGPCAHDQRTLHRRVLDYLRDLVRASGRTADDFLEEQIEDYARHAIRRYGLRVELRRNAGHIAARVYPDGVSQAVTEDFLI